jgi:alpha-ketoglutarate-dependent taurine dioxygenase
MQYQLASNGWTPIIDNFDLRTATQDDINQIARLIATNTMVVIKRQTLSIEEELRVTGMFKDVGSFLSYDEIDASQLAVPNTNGKLLRVGGKRNEAGVEGISAHPSEMAWHIDFHWAKEKDKVVLIWLHGVEGVTRSRTSWLNGILAYRDLDKETQEFLSTAKATMSRYVWFDVDVFTEDEDGTRWAPGEEFSNYQCDLVNTTITGEKALFFPFYNMHHLNNLSREESKKIFLKVAELITQDKYCYHHEWDEGDIVISDNRLGLHKRWPCEQIASRLLHRAMFDYPDSIK